jgi:hypothetical protein
MFGNLIIRSHVCYVVSIISGTFMFLVLRLGILLISVCMVLLEGFSEQLFNVAFLLCRIIARTRRWK